MTIKSEEYCLLRVSQDVSVNTDRGLSLDLSIRVDVTDGGSGCGAAIAKKPAAKGVQDVVADIVCGWPTFGQADENGQTIVNETNFCYPNKASFAYGPSTVLFIELWQTT